jgi:hypothetical protein
MFFVCVRKASAWHMQSLRSLLLVSLTIEASGADAADVALPTSLTTCVDVEAVVNRYSDRSNVMMPQLGDDGTAPRRWSADTAWPARRR